MSNYKYIKFDKMEGSDIYIDTNSRISNPNDIGVLDPPLASSKINSVTPDFTDKITQDIIEKTYYRDLNYNINSKFRWKAIGDVMEALSFIFIGIGVVLAFSAGYFDNSVLSFVAGCVETMGIVLKQFSSYSHKESVERTKQVNTLLTELGLDNVVNVIDPLNKVIAKHKK